MNERLEGFETRNGTVTGVVTPRRTLPADIVILGLGVRPNTKLGAEAGLALGEKGA
ncbi:MAG TPA: flavoprotein oxidoreductase, partial [Sulfobacillus sp.]|nr:flavoprotein oxidoreductase [Sulfobacillus sp.]